MNHQLIDVDIDEIKRLYTSGHTAVDIADYLSVSREVVVIRLRKMKLMPPKGKGRKYAQDPIGATHQAYYRHLKAQYVMECLKCGRKFKSWDRKKNRLCQKCQTSNAETYTDMGVDMSDVRWAARMG